jgi:anti-sigma B factor antagonist
MIAKTETLGGCKILRVSGRIDFESALDFEHHINAMIQEAGDSYIIELSQVELLSSAGLRVMLSTAKRVAHRNAALALAAPSQVVRQVFEISHFNLLFKIFPSVPAAIAALKGTAEVVQPEGSFREPTVGPGPTGLEETKLSETVLPTEESVGQAGPPQRLEPSLSGPLSPASQLPTTPRSTETPTIAPSPLPTVILESTKAPAATVVPNKPESAPSRQTPPPLPVVKPPSSVAPAPVQPPAARSSGLAARREAKYPALLEVRAEGTSYPCKDGDVIGTEGRLAQPYFSQIAHLAPRHLLIGLLEGRWFVFTPKNVQHPFVLDGVALRAGERKMLQYVEHQVEFSGHVFGFRLVAQPAKEGFFARIFGRKK